MSKDQNKYHVELVATNRKDSTLLGTPTGVRKAKGIAGKVGKWAADIGACLMIATMVFLGTVSAAGPANALGIDDIGRSPSEMARNFCGPGLFGYDVSERVMLFAPDVMKSGNDPDATAWEKYGMSGTSLTSWVGPDRQEDLDGNGYFGGKAIVNKAGGADNNGGVDKWGNEVQSPNKVATSNTDFYNTDQECSNIASNVTDGNASMGDMAANALLGYASFIVWAGNQLLFIAFSPDANIVAALMPVLEKLTTLLAANVFAQYLTIAIMIGACVLAYTGLVKRQGTIFIRQLAYMIFSTAAISVLLLNATLTFTTINKAVMLPSTAVLAATSSVTGDGADICFTNPDGTRDPNEKVNRSIRQIQCQVWKTAVYEPWAMAQFGDDPAKYNELWGTAGSAGPVLKGTDIAGGVNVASQNIKNDTALSYLDAKVNSEGVDGNGMLDKVREMLTISAQQLHTDSGNATFRGDNTFMRVIITGLGALMATMIGVFLVSMSLTMLVIQIGLLASIVALPVLGLMMIVPGQGEQLARKWLTDIGIYAGTMVALSLILGLLISAYATIMSTLSSEGFFTTFVLLAGVTIAAWKSKSNLGPALQKMFGAGNGTMTWGSRMDKKVKGAGKGALAGGAAIAVGAVTGSPHAAMATRSALQAATRTGNGSNTGNGGSGPAPKSGPKDNGTSTFESAPNESLGRKSTPSGAGGSGEAPRSSRRKVQEDWQTASPVPPSTPTEHEQGTTAPTASAPAHTVRQPAPTPEQDKLEAGRDARVTQDLKKQGYRSRISAGTVAKAMVAGAVVGAATGNSRQAFRAGGATAGRARQVLASKNAEAVRRVKANEQLLASEARELDRQNAQVAAAAEKERRAKQVAEERAAREQATASEKQSRDDEKATQPKSPQSAPTVPGRTTPRRPASAPTKPTSKGGAPIPKRPSTSTSGGNGTAPKG